MAGLLMYMVIPCLFRTPSFFVSPLSDKMVLSQPIPAKLPACQSVNVRDCTQKESGMQDVNSELKQSREGVVSHPHWAS